MALAQPGGLDADRLVGLMDRNPQRRDPRSGGGKLGARSIVAARLDRSLIDAGYRALHAAGHATDTILVGELAPEGDERPGVSRPVAPLPFLRALYCVDAPRSRSPARPRAPADARPAVLDRRSSRPIRACLTRPASPTMPTRSFCHRRRR